MWGSIIVYALIFFAKVIEVSLMTLRVVLITKGERRIGAVIGFFEVSLWIVIASTVISGVADDPIKAIVYALGFSCGNYMGSILESKIGLGVSEIKAIVKKIHGQDLAKHMRELGYAVTVVEGEGMNFDRNILFMFVKRKNVKACVQALTYSQSNAVITVSELKPMYGGFGLIRK